MRSSVSYWGISLWLRPLIQPILIGQVWSVADLSMGLDIRWLGIEWEVEGLINIRGETSIEVEVVEIKVELTKILRFQFGIPRCAIFREEYEIVDRI